MLWLERQVVDTLAGDVGPRRRLAIEGYVDGVLRDMPEHLRMGVAAESIVLGGGEWVARKLGSRRTLASRLVAWEENPIGPIRQYARLFSSLVIFASEELAPEPTDAEPTDAEPTDAQGADAEGAA
jgi:hypothetical protein